MAQRLSQASTSWNLPAMPVDEFRLDRVAKQEFESRALILVAHADDAGGGHFGDEQRLASGLGMHANHGLGDRRIALAHIGQVAALRVFATVMSWMPQRPSMIFFILSDSAS